MFCFLFSDMMGISINIAFEKSDFSHRNDFANKINRFRMLPAKQGHKV